MCKIRTIIVLLFVCLFTSFAQTRKYPMALGVYYESNNDLTKRGKTYGGGVTSDYSTTRDRLGLEVLYGLTKRLQMESGLGITAYNSELLMGKGINTSVPTMINISSLNLVLSQKALYNVFDIACGEYFKISFSPYVTLAYEQFLSKNREREYPSGDQNYLFSESADRIINTSNMPAVIGKTKEPVGILSVIGGISAEALIGKKIGVSGELGYSHSLFGHSIIDVKWRYEGDEIHSDSFKSENSGLSAKVKLHFYF